MKRLNVPALIFGMALVFGGGGALKAQSLPSVKFGDQDTLVSPADADTYFNTTRPAELSGITFTRICGDLDSHTTGSCPINPAVPVEIQEVAKGLGANRLDDAEFIKNAFEYVYKNVEITPLFGLQKGALGTLIDWHGTAFDQAALLVELLRQDTNVTASYKYGTITLNQAEFDAWFGEDTAYAACKLLANGGIPAVVNGTLGCDSFVPTTALSTVTMKHVWVEASSGATPTYTLDPAYKTHTETAGLAQTQIETAMGFTATGFYNAIATGADIDVVASTVRQLNHSELYTMPITTSAMNRVAALHTYVETNLPLAHTRDLVGGREIDRSVFDLDDGGIADVPGYSSQTVSATWSEVPDSYRSTVRLVYGTLDLTLFADELSGRPFYVETLTEDLTRASVGPRLKLGSLILGSPSSAPASLQLTANHPYAASSGGHMDRTITRDLGSLATGNFTIVADFGSAGPRRVEYDRQQLAEAVMPADFYDEDNRLRHNLQRRVTISDWLGQISVLAELFGNVSDDHLVSQHHVLGVLGDTTTESYLSVDSSLSVINENKDDTRRKAAQLSLASFMAALEGHVVSQTSGAGSNATPMAFARHVFKHNNQVFFDITSEAAWDSAVGQTANYTTAATQLIDDYAVNGYRVIVPEVGDIDIWNNSSSLWQPCCNLSSAFLAISTDGNEVAHMVSADAARTHFVKGGTGFREGLPEDPLAIFEWEGGIPVLTAGLTVEPTTGRLSISQTDMVVGAGAFPNSLPFTRTLNSPDRLNTETRPGGWNNFYDLSAGTSANALSGMGYGDQVPALAALDMIAAIHMTTELLAAGTDVTRLVISQVLANWPVNFFGANLQVVDTFEGPKTFHSVYRQPGAWIAYEGDVHVPQLGEHSTLYLVDPEFSSDMELITKDGTKYYIDRLDQYGDGGPAAVATGLGAYNTTGTSFPLDTRNSEVLGYGCSGRVDDGFNQDAPHPVSNYVSRVDWVTGEAIGIIRRGDCGSPIARVVNHLGHHLNFSLLGGANNTTLTIDDGPGGRSMTISPTSVTLPDGATITYAFEGDAAPEIGVNRVAPVVGNRLTSVTLPADAQPFLQYSYDALGRVATVTDAESRTVNWHTDDLTRVQRSEVVSPLGDTAVTYFDDNGRTVKLIDPLGRMARTVYDAIGRPVRSIMPEGDETLTEYDARSNVTRQVQKAKPGSGLADLEALWTFATDCSVTSFGITTNACDRPQQATDPRGNVTYFDYDSYGRITGLKEPCALNGTCGEGDSNRPVTSITYQDLGNSTEDALMAFGRPTSMTDPAGVTTAYAYNASGKLLSSTVDPTGLALRSVYYWDAVGNLCRSVSPKGSAGLTGTEPNACLTSVATGGAYATISQYDDNRRVTRTIDGLGNFTDTEYNANGWPIYTRSYDNTSTLIAMSGTTYFDDGQVREQLDGDCFDLATGFETRTNGRCGISTNSYDLAGRLDIVTDGIGRQTRNQYDAAGQLTKVIGAYGSALQQDTATYTYTDNGQRDTVMDANGNVSDYTYDGFDRLARLDYPSAKACGAGAGSCSISNPNMPDGTDYEEYQYDANGNVENRRTRAGDWIVKTFDALNRETAKDVRLGSTSGTGERSITTVYDLAGRIETITSVQGGDTASVAYLYDDAGRQVDETQTLNGVARAAGYGYDLNSNVAVVQHAGGSTLRVNFVHDELDRVDRICNAANETPVNTSTCAATDPYVEYQYDGLSRRITSTFGNGRVKSYAYEDDAALQSITHTDLVESSPGVLGNAVWSFGYTPANQVSSKTLPTAFRYTANPGVVNDNYEVNGLNQYSSVGGNALSYDDNGNLNAAGIWSYSYDAENRLITAANGLITASYSYGPLDRRIKKTVTANGGTPVETLFLYAGDDVIAEFEGDGTLLREYVHGPWVDEPVVMVDPTQTQPDWRTQFFHADHAGSVVATSDAAGALRDAYQYSSFGEVGTGLTTGSPYRFTGRRYDPETGLYYYRARYYSAAMGRFLQTDPIGYVDSLGLYQYAKNDPLGLKDPTGFISCDSGGVTCYHFTAESFLSTREGQSKLEGELRNNYSLFFPTDDGLDEEKLQNFKSAVVDAALAGTRYADSQNNTFASDYSGTFANSEVSSFIYSASSDFEYSDPTVNPYGTGSGAGGDGLSIPDGSVAQFVTVPRAQFRYQQNQKYFNARTQRRFVIQSGIVGLPIIARRQGRPDVYFFNDQISVRR